MKYALINPNWTFDGSIYFGCREAHLPLEFGYSRALLEAAGHEVLLIDGQMFGLHLDEIRAAVRSFAPHFTVVCTAPSYLFWRCAPPELRVPQELIRAVRDAAGTLIAVGPHGSTTPVTTLRKLGADAVVMGECEDILPQLTGSWSSVPSICYRPGGKPWIQGTTHATDVASLGALRWDSDFLSRHRHHHHRFDRQPEGPGAEMETSRGCPYHCTFCAKDNFRDKYRRRPVSVILDEVDGLIERGIEYIYFIDEIFLPNRPLLEGLVDRQVQFGVQTRLDLWKDEDIELMGHAGCVSIEAGVESITETGRENLDKKCRMSTSDLANKLLLARKHVPFVQANLIEVEEDEITEVQAFRQQMIAGGVWANDPVPLFPYPGSPEYTRRWGTPDERAWERATDYYLEVYDSFSDIQESRPRRLQELEFAEPIGAC